MQTLRQLSKSEIQFYSMEFYETTRILKRIVLRVLNNVRAAMSHEDIRYSRVLRYKDINKNLRKCFLVSKKISR